ncbi:MAG TPA: aldolase/citrate lyase family protein [Jiangellaceae bacterium]
MADLRAMLQDGNPILGTVVTVDSPQVAEALVLAGVQWLFLDSEHSAALDPGAVQRIVQAVGSRCPAVVRVPANDATWIHQALDAGADGVIVPHVRSAADARQAVSAVKYPPLGARSVGIARAHGYGLRFAEYLRSANDRTALVVQIEDIDAVEALPEILAVTGVDAVFVGPYDLSGSMGLLGQVDHPSVRAAVDEVRRVCAEAGMPLGIFTATAEAARAEVTSGSRLIAVGTDLGLMTSAAQAIADLV